MMTQNTVNWQRFPDSKPMDGHWYFVKFLPFTFLDPGWRDPFIAYRRDGVFVTVGSVPIYDRDVEKFAEITMPE